MRPDKHNPPLRAPGSCLGIGRPGQRSNCSPVAPCIHQIFIPQRHPCGDTLRNHPPGCSPQWGWRCWGLDGWADFGASWSWPQLHGLGVPSSRYCQVRNPGKNPLRRTCSRSQPAGLVCRQRTRRPAPRCVTVDAPLRGRTSFRDAGSLQPPHTSPGLASAPPESSCPSPAAMRSVPDQPANRNSRVDRDTDPPLPPSIIAGLVRPGHQDRQHRPPRDRAPLPRGTPGRADPS